ncbi:MAG: helix-hairpin-helix domain-containing protein [Armatimonadota bacterium]|nr:helix-hairpin-helix domain-containing protein [Armatimonadota bacterium]
MLLAMGIGAILVGALVRLFLAAYPPAPPPAEDLAVPSLIAVHISGAVRFPGLYRLRVGSRVGDILTKAGGPTEEADLRGLNLAMPLRDGDRVVVPPRLPRSKGAQPGAREGVIDLNKASVAELEALPGIGPVLARRIVEYRSKAGPFRRVEELLKVRGVGPKLVAKLRPYVTVRELTP